MSAAMCHLAILFKAQSWGADSWSESHHWRMEENHKSTMRTAEQSSMGQFQIFFEKKTCLDQGFSKKVSHDNGQGPKMILRSSKNRTVFCVLNHNNLWTYTTIGTAFKYKVKAVGFPNRFCSNFESHGQKMFGNPWSRSVCDWSKGLCCTVRLATTNSETTVGFLYQCLTSVLLYFNRSSCWLVKSLLQLRCCQKFFKQKKACGQLEKANQNKSELFKYDNKWAYCGWNVLEQVFALTTYVFPKYLLL